jgi:hypothetical protein
MSMKKLFIVLAALAGCGGGSNLGGDGGDSGSDLSGDRVDIAETAEPGDAPVDPADVPADGIPETADLVDGINPCAPQDARADGPCAAEVPGVKWDGAHCVPLGSGCSCVGADCASVYENVEGCVEARRGCYAAGCDPQPVAYDPCMVCDDAVFLGVYWTGRECLEMVGCGCRGEGCGRGFSSVPECEAFTAACDAELCRSTGGLWFPAQAGFSGVRCGLPREDDIQLDVCLCRPGDSFTPGVGCSVDASCTREDICMASRGAWHPASECFCGFTCGVPNDCEACVDSCDCGPRRNFDPAAGCVPDEACGGEWQEPEICMSTGGTWVYTGSCGHYTCGIPNTLDPCVMPGCDCGPRSNFDPERGCIYDEGCFFREVDQDCRGWGESGTCRAGLVCCAFCGIPTGCMRCANPCCEGDPLCMEDGCPPPPP